MSVPPAIREALTAHLGATVRDIVVLASAPTGSRARLTVGDQPAVLKWLPAPTIAPDHLDPCAAEAHGLLTIAATGTVRVPQVLASGNAAGNVYVLAEWIEAGPKDNAVGERLGVALAALHHEAAPTYGLDQHNYCGTTPQRNTPDQSWLCFYRDQRLAPQIEGAAERGLLPTTRRRRLAWLVEHLDRWLPDQPEPPALIHGDLWGGNWLATTDGAPVLVDPAVSWSHREAELAMCHLFGGFPQRFFAAYDEAHPPLPDRAERRPLYQLYHLLNHLNVFGESYGSAVDGVLARYAE